MRRDESSFELGSMFRASSRARNASSPSAPAPWPSSWRHAPTHPTVGSVELVADLAGYETGGFIPAGPTRILDTRAGTGASKGQVGAGQSITLTVPNVPSGANTVVLNLTGTGLTGASTSFVSACPAAVSTTTCSATSALNAYPGVDVANEITVPVASDGTVTLYNNAGSIDLVADLAGSHTH